jgi:hypothetical protein
MRVARTPRRPAGLSADRNGRQGRRRRQGSGCTSTGRGSLAGVVHGACPSKQRGAGHGHPDKGAALAPDVGLSLNSGTKGDIARGPSWAHQRTLLDHHGVAPQRLGGGGLADWVRAINGHQHRSSDHFIMTRRTRSTQSSLDQFRHGLFEARRTSWLFKDSAKLARKHQS